MDLLTSPTKTGDNKRLRVGSLEELKRQGCMVARGTDRPVALFYHNNEVRAVDNRCPHLGFPLHKGTVQDGILICHWHHARFDLASGCTFDLWADDVPAYPVEMEGDDIYIYPNPAGEGAGRGFRRLRIGMEQNVGLIIAKSVIRLLKDGAPVRDIVREGALFGARNRDGWGSGLVILGAMANLGEILPRDEIGLPLAHGIAAAARDTAGMAPRRDRYALDRRELDMDTARSWFRHWSVARHRDGAERTLMTILENGYSSAQAADVVFTAITDRFYADGGHTLDFANKAFEVADLIGWEHASELLPALSPGIVNARGAEESSPWRYPVDLISLQETVFDRLPELIARGAGKQWSQEPELADRLLSEDPAVVINALVESLEEGARPVQLGRALALAAAIRIARFGTANEFGDWDTALHTFTYANALHQVLKRCSSPDILRGVFHGAMSVYQDRFLNVPPTPIPMADEDLKDLPGDENGIISALMEALNMQQRVGEAARLVSRYVGLGLPDEPLIAALTYATVREDAAFHTFQMLEAGIRQYQGWKGTPQARIVLVAVARYIAAHSPTTRSFLQSYDIAVRLHRGDALYED